MSTDQPDGEENEVQNIIIATIERMGERMTARLERIEKTMATKDDITAVRGDIEQVQLRLGGIEKSVASRMADFDARLSRMRSVLYILVKDRPEILRLLGE